jgi:hypothetical protein
MNSGGVIGWNPWPSPLLLAVVFLVIFLVARRIGCRLHLGHRTVLPPHQPQQQPEPRVTLRLRGRDCVALAVVALAAAAFVWLTDRIDMLLLIPRSFGNM